MPFDKNLIEDSVDRYRRERDRYVKLADRVAEICREDICEENSLRAQVTFRVKSADSFRGKLRRFSEMENKNYKNIDDVFASVSDLAGVRVSAYRFEDCDRIVDLIFNKFNDDSLGKKVEVDKKDKLNGDNGNFYRATHIQVYLPDDELIGSYDNVGDISCEIQVCTMMAHVWNEIEHDIGYKAENGGPSPDEVKMLTMLGHTARLGDQQISLILSANAKGGASHVSEIQEVAFRNNFDFVARTQEFYGDVMPKFSDNSGTLFEAISVLGLDTPESVRQAVEPLDAQALENEAMAINAYLVRKDDSRLLFDPKSSDLLLLRIFQTNLSEILDSGKGRFGRGRGRPTRLHRLALRYRDWKSSHLQS